MLGSLKRELGDHKGSPLPCYEIADVLLQMFSLPADNNGGLAPAPQITNQVVKLLASTADVGVSLQAVDEAQAYLVGTYVGSHRGALDPRTSNCPFRIT
jgi:hypothetical protein